MTIKRTAIAVLAALCPMAAFADISGTATLSTGQGFSFDSGATTTSGDITFTGSSITFTGSAKGGVIPGFSGASSYALLDQSILKSLAALATAAPIPASSLPVGAIAGVQTNAVNAAKFLVTAISSSSITFQYTTYGATGGTTPGGPTVTLIQNNYSYLVPGLPNYGISPGTIMFIKGTGLATATTVSSLQDSTAGSGIPTTLNGASISVTVNGVTTTPGIYYAIDKQIAAVLPSGTPTGTGTLTVTVNNVKSNAASITVIPSALGLDSLYGSGTGIGVATDAVTGVSFNYTNSAKPGETIVLWGSGLGADTADSDVLFTHTPHAVNVPLTVYIGGVAVTPLYAGSSGYPGLNQINLTIPANVTTGCAVAVVAISGSIVSNTVTLPINAGGGVCSDPILGTDGNQITTLGGKTNYSSGSLTLIQGVSGGTTLGIAGGFFQHVSGVSSASGSGISSLNNCIVSSQATGGTTLPTTSGLDAGTITLQGPTGTQTLTATAIPGQSGASGLYLAQLPSSFITPGSFTFKGTGGADVGAFTVTVNYTSPLVWTNMNAITSVTRTSGVNVTWTGGASGTYVIISGGSSSATASGSFTCLAPASAGQFTVPSYVLLALPAGSGSLSLENATSPVSFTATGLDLGAALAAATFSITPAYN